MDEIENLIEAHSSEIFAYLYRMLGDHAAAKDVLAEVFVKMVQNTKARSGEANMCRAWLYRVATNFAISQIRKNKVRKFFAIRFGPIERGDECSALPDEELSRNEDAAKVKMAVEKLGGKFKSVVIMRYYQDLSYEEIADTLKMNIGTVKSRLNEAKKKIAVMMELEDKND